MFKSLKTWFRWTEGSGVSETSSSLTLTDSQEQADPEVEHLVTEIVRLHKELSLKADLRPCDEVDTLFGALVGLCTQTLSEYVTSKVMNSPEIIDILPSLRYICAKAECYLESHWADIISGSEDETEEEDTVYGHLTQFPYFSNYVDLTRMELAAIHAVNASPIRKIAFLGSGPLPLTSLRLCHTLSNNITVLNIDNNSLAISQSSNLCARLGRRGRGMEFKCSDAGSEHCDLKDFDVVYLAALVGSSREEKEGLLVGVVGRMREGAVLVVRSAWGLRRLLYAEFDPTTDAVKRCLDVQIVVHPFNHVVNSVIVGRVRRRGGDRESLG